MELTVDIAKKIGDKFGVDWNAITPETLIKGAKVEFEHKDLFPEKGETLKNWAMACKIASDHLKESPKYYEELKKMEKNLDETALREVIRKVVRKHLKEIHYPPKSIDYNKLPDTDGFWNWPVKEAAQEAGLRDIGFPFKMIGDVILWLNMAGMYWEHHK